MTPTFLPLKWIVSIFLNEQLSRGPFFVMCMIHVHVCVDFARGYPEFKNPCGIHADKCFAVGGGITHNMRDGFGQLLRKCGEFGNDSGGVQMNLQKRTELILDIASQCKGTPNANSRGIDPGHCCAEGNTDKQNARN